MNEINISVLWILKCYLITRIYCATFPGAMFLVYGQNGPIEFAGDY